MLFKQHELEKLLRLLTIYMSDCVQPHEVACAARDMEQLFKKVETRIAHRSGGKMSRNRM